MQVLSDIKQTQQLCQQWKSDACSISFVPTMGCLHEGHLSLIKRAKSIADYVVVSIFVNPLQFDNIDDLEKYPNTLDEDIHKLKEAGVDLVFTPDASSFYPDGNDELEILNLGTITSLLEGENRPGHFDGVVTVVKRLFKLIMPNVAIFGEKDFQQLIIVKQLVSLLEIDVKIISMPTFRESDGLAMSSRNTRLNDSERQLAPEIHRQLQKIKKAIKLDSYDFLELEAKACEELVAKGFNPDYVTIRDEVTLSQAKDHGAGVVILIAAKLGEIRLIDNMRV